MRFLSVCSGIESASVAWEPLGWRPIAFSEIEPFPCAVLKHRFPCVPNWGDMTRFEEWPDANVDVLVGGTPCQDYSVAGLRAGMAGSRGSLALTFVEIAARYRPRFIVWENVCGVLSSNLGRDFARFLGDFSGKTIAVPDGGWGNAGIVEGIPDAYGLAYRVLDSQYARVDGYPRAVPQRRQRVFVVGYLGDWRPPAAALFEPEGLRGDSAPRRTAGKGHTGASTFCSGGGRQSGGVDVAASLAAHGQPLDWAVETFAAEQVASTVTSNCDAHSGFRDHAGLVAFPLRGRDGGAMAEVEPGGVSPAIRAADGGSTRPMVVQTVNMQGGKGTASFSADLSFCLGADSQIHAINDGYTVRRLSVTECHRLQGFPDGWCNVPWRGKEYSPDGPQYKAIGNSKAVNVVRWVGQRIQMVDDVIAGIGGQPVAADALAGARRPVTSLKLPGAAASGLLGGGE